MKKHLLALALIPAAFVGCTDDSYDLDNMSNDYRIGLNEYLPIASSEVKLKDILSEFKTGYIRDTTDGTLNFVFDTTTHVNIKPFDIVFEAATFDRNFKEVAADVISNDVLAKGFFVDIPVKLDVDSKDGVGKIYEIEVKSGEINVRLEGTGFDISQINVKEIKIPEIDLSDASKFPDPKTGALKIDLSGKTLKFPNGELVITAEIQVLSPLKITDSNVGFKMVLERTELKYKKIVGTFQSYTEQLEKTSFYLNLYDDNMDYKLKVLDPQLSISATTNSELPLDCWIKSLVGKHKTTKVSKKDSMDALFNYADESTNEFVVNSKSYHFPRKTQIKNVAFSGKFDKSNGCLDSLFNYMPDSVCVTSSLRIDGDTNVTYTLKDSTYVDLNIHATVPLYIGESSYVTIKDTVDGIDIAKDITDYQNGDFKLDQAEIVIEFENALPVEGVITAKFCKADTLANGDVKYTRINNTKLDKVVKIPAAQVGNDGRVVAAKPSTSKISLSDDMIEDIKKINAIDFTYKISVPRGDVKGVYLTNKDGMSAKVYTHLKANISNIEK